MSSALLQLLVLSLKGRAVRFARQLRSPRYLIGLGVGVAWLSFWMKDAVRGGLAHRVATEGPGDWIPDELAWFVRFAVAAIAFVWFALLWLVPWTRFGMPLNETELHLLLPAPLSRRRLIGYALLKTQTPILVSSLLLTAFTATPSLSGRLQRFTGLWLFLTVWELHTRFRAMTILRWRQRQGRELRWPQLAVASVALVLLVIAASRIPAVVAMGRDAIDSASGEPRGALLEFLATIGAGLRSDPLSRILGPFLALTGPAFAASLSAFLLACAPLALVGLLLYEGTVRSKARFEEPALDHARRQLERRGPRRTRLGRSRRGRRTEPFALAPLGRGEVAIVWKNLRRVWRMPLGRLAWIGAAGVGAIGLAFAIARPPGFFYAIAWMIGLSLAGFSPWVTAMNSPIGVRGELEHLDVVRAWPLSASRFVAAQVAGPALVGAAGGLAGVGLAVVVALAARATGTETVPHIGLGMIAAGATSAVPLVLGIAALASALINVAALAFPSWVGVLGGSRPQGIAVVGQRLLVSTAMVFALAVGLVPGGLAASLLFLGTWALGLGVPVVLWPLGALIAAGPLVVEAALLVQLGSRLWARLE